MERKLLSLPSFFVLLLVAGIAFLAAPVVDVQATVPTATVTATTTGGNVVATITFNVAVKATTAGPPPVLAAVGFGREDLSVTKTITMPAAAAVADAPLAAGEWTLTTPSSGANANKVWTVTATKPTNSDGSITVAIKSTAAGLQEAGAGNTDAYVYDATDTQTESFTDHDGTKPTVGIALDSPAGSRSLEPFLVTFTFTDAGGFATAGPTSFALGSINVTGGEATELGSLTGTSSPYTMKAYIQADSGVSEVLIGVAANAVMDAAGNGNDAVPHVRGATDTPPAVPSGTLRVVVDTIKPFVDIGTVTTPASPTAESPVTSIAVTFTVKEESATGAATKTEALGASAARAIVATEVTVEGGTITAPVAKTGTFDAVFTATITPEATATEVTISVNAGAVVDAAGNGNARTMPAKTVSTGYVAPTTPPPTPTVPEEGTALTGGVVGFTFDVNIPARSFVVLAKSPNDAGFTDSLTTEIDIKDDAWQDLTNFMGVGPGGAIDLISPVGRASTSRHELAVNPSQDLVISEIMWGSDEGLGTTDADRAKSQWIELYNTTSAAISGTWELRFTKSATGEGVTNDRLADKFTNFGLTQSNQYWAIPDTAGGAYGQSGRTSSPAANQGTLRRLVSMARKIDFAKVEKLDHDNDSAKNRTKQLEGVPAGDLAGSWEASKDPQGAHLTGRRLGTPGAAPFVTVNTTKISKAVVFNEVANREGDVNDWIELYNPGSSDVTINGWVLSKVTAVDTDEVLFKFESDESIVVPAKGFLLVVNEDPSETSLAAGANVENPDSNANGLPTKFYINSQLKIPEKDYLLILRTEDKKGTDEKIVDIAGNIGAMKLSDPVFKTDLWPLKAWNVIKTDDLTQNNGKTWIRDKGKNLNHADAWKADGGVTGLGIDRAATTMHSGTPGFDNGAVKDKVKDLTESDPVVISEIMFGTGTNNLPQWIELFNPSKTQAVKLNAWRLEVQNAIDPSEVLEVDSNYTLVLPDVRIQPYQTVLIVSTSARNSTRDRFPADRIINIWKTRSLRETINMESARYAILSTIGFHIKLSDPDKKVVDQIGNIDSNRRTPDAPAWTLPGGNLDDGGRASMIRRQGTFGDGTEADTWISAAATAGARQVGIDELYYGSADDLGTPGYRAGGPLPVQLSSFYSKRNDAGAVIITWATESELDNAGFNILRSVSRTGEFTRINAQLIPGAGTTGEKNTYTWTDTSAKPNVLYYYQIEDVSLDGEHRTLRTTRLRGYVGASGKATTIWGELKSRD